MASDRDESLADLGYAIYALLEQIAVFRTSLSDKSEFLQTLDLIINDGDRFKIWSTSAGLLIPGHGSLDYRVREAESLSNTIRSFLADLRENFEEVLTLDLQHSSANPSNISIIEEDKDVENDEDDGEIVNILLETIREIIDRLYRLATKLRTPETRLRSSRAQNFHKLHDGVDLFEHFGEFERDFVSSLFRQYRRGSKLADLLERTVSPDRNSKFDADDGTSQYLIERITLANVARRRQFAYWRHHHLKLEKHTEAAVATRRFPGMSSIPPIPASPVATSRTPVMTISTATQLPNTAPDFNDLASIFSVSEYVPSSADKHSDLLVFPPPPRVSTSSRFFECPYCFTTCDKKTLRTRAWQAHLIHDLRPYICTYENCRTPDQLYDTKSDWIQHETTSHAMIWKCPVHPNKVFEDAVAFRLHAADGHIQDVLPYGSVQEVAIAEYINKTDRPCPICAKSDLPAAQLHDHIAIHLERLALFSLPKHIGTNEADDDIQGSDEANDAEDSRDFDMKSALSFESVPTSMLVRGAPPEEDPCPQSPPVSNSEEQTRMQDLAWNEHKLGLEHPSTLSAAFHLGILYQDQGKLDQAEQMYHRALAGQDRVIGPEHPTTLDTVHRLGLLYQSQDKLEEAEQMYLRALAGREKTLGLEHVWTLDTVYHLGFLYQEQGKLDQAEQMYERDLAGREHAFGPEYPSTLDTIDSLGLLYQEQGKLDQAEQMCRRAVAGRMEALGADHPNTLRTAERLAMVLSKQGKHLEAEEMSRSVVADFTKLLGREHPRTLHSMSNLALVLHRLGRDSEAGEIYHAVVEVQERVLGKESPETLRSMYRLAIQYGEVRRRDEAIQLMEHVVKVQNKVVGEKHPDTLQSKTLLAHLHGKQEGEMTGLPLV